MNTVEMITFGSSKSKLKMDLIQNKHANKLKLIEYDSPIMELVYRTKW